MGYDSLLHREHFGHGHEARVAAGKKVGVCLRQQLAVVVCRLGLHCMQPCTCF
jgi:hypothetical protein